VPYYTDYSFYHISIC